MKMIRTMMIALLAGVLIMPVQAEDKAKPDAVVTESPLKFGINTYCAKQADKAVVCPGEEACIDVPVSNITDKPFKALLRFSASDFYGHQVGVSEHEISLEPKAKAAAAKTVIPLRFKTDTKGVCRVGVEFEFEGGKYAQDVASFAVWPMPDERNRKYASTTFFRDVISTWEADGAMLNLAARLGQNWVLGHDMMQATWWSYSQPVPGPFIWSKEYQVSNAKKFGMNLCGEFLGAPPWASTDSEAAKQPTSKGYPPPVVPRLEPFLEYVRAMVGHYKGDIHYWQVYSEPHVCIFWNGPVDYFAQLCQAAAKTAKEVDPSCKVLGSGLGLAQRSWNEEFAKHGGFAEFDIASIHNYFDATPPEQAYEQLKSGLDHFRGLMRQYPPHRELPIWNTEGGHLTSTYLRGVDTGKLIDPMVGVKALTKFYAIEFAMGVEAHFYFLQNTASGLSSCDIGRVPKPILMARVAMQDELAGFVFRKLFRSGDEKGRLWAVLFEDTQAGGTVAMTWCGEGGVIELDLAFDGRLKEVHDIMGNRREAGSTLSISDETCYLRLSCPAEQAERMIAAAHVKVLKVPTPLPVEDKSEIKPQLPPLNATFASSLEKPDALFTVDIRPYCNMDFADERAGDGKGGWNDEGMFNDMRCVPEAGTGIKKHFGIPFEILEPAASKGKTVITMKGSTTPAFPDKVTIDLGGRKNVRALYFLFSGGADYGQKGEIFFDVKCANGKVESIPVIKGVNFICRWWGYKPQEDKNLKDVRAVPYLSKNTNTGKPAYRYLSVMEWQNPTPDVPLESLTIRIDKVDYPYQACNIVAISGTTW